MTLYLGNNLISGSQVVTDKSERIGQIIQSTIPLTDAGLHLLDGSLISGSGSYSAFFDYIGDLYDSGNYSDIFETEANWQTSVTTYGVCGKFVYDNVNNTVRLPKITGFVESTIDPTTLGDLTEAGLPNITGSLKTYVDIGRNAGTGALSRYNDGTHHVGTGTGSGTQYNQINFDASHSNSIYGNSSTVQPQSTKVLYYIVIATTTKTDIQVDIDEIATDLNSKADVDLLNINNSGTSKGASWAFPSSTYESLTLGANGSEYTAPSNGWVYIAFRKNDQNYASVSAWTYYLAARGQSDTGQGDALVCYIPVTRGQTFGVSYLGNITLTSFFFIYAVGSESEAN